MLLIQVTILQLVNSQMVLGVFLNCRCRIFVTNFGVHVHPEPAVLLAHTALLPKLVQRTALLMQQHNNHTEEEHGDANVAGLLRGPPVVGRSDWHKRSPYST